MRLSWRGDKPVLLTGHGDVYLIGPQLAREEVIRFFMAFEKKASVSVDAGTVDIVDEEAMQAISELDEELRRCQDKVASLVDACATVDICLKKIGELATVVSRRLWEDPVAVQSSVDGILDLVREAMKTLEEVDA